jgi:hypothetical protein
MVDVALRTAQANVHQVKMIVEKTVATVPRTQLILNVQMEYVANQAK